MYSLRQLQVFVAVARAGTLRGAAQALLVSESAVGAALNDLESALGVQLCVRRRAHGVSLTPTGEAVLLRARALLQEADDLEGEAAGTTGALSGRLVIGCYPTLGPTLLAPLLAGFGARHPAVEIDFHEDAQDRLHQRLRSGELDLTLTYDLELPGQLRSVSLATRTPYVLLAPDHPLASVERLDLAALATEPMVLIDSSPSRAHAFVVCRLAGFAPAVRYRTANYETARSLVARGLGWTLLVQRPVHDLTYDGLSVVARTPDRPAVAPVHIVASWLQDARLSRPTRAFLGYASTTPPPP